MFDAVTDFVWAIARAFPADYARGVLINGTIVGVVYLLFWKVFSKRLRQWRIQFDRQPNAAQIKRELWNAVFAMAAGAFLSSVMIYLATQGMTQIYFDLSDHHVLVALAGIPMLLLVNDAWFYWVHRILHHPRIYKYVHAEHHRSMVVNPLTSFSFHWLEPILLTLWIIPVTLLVPVYAPVLGIIQIYGLYDNIKSHLGYELFPRWFNRSPLRMLTSSTYHTLHHTRFKGNYGLHFRIWDRLMGTELPQYEASYDEITTRRSEKHDGGLASGKPG
jgi:Delta7-sterol 5-desaturase